MSKIKKFRISKYKKEIKPIIQMKNISKKYEVRNVLQNLNFNILPSSITGLLGPNGSGKTTIFNCLLGIIKQDSGELNICPDGKKKFRLQSSFKESKIEGSFKYLRDKCNISFFPDDKIKNTLKHINTIRNNFAQGDWDEIKINNSDGIKGK